MKENGKIRIQVSEIGFLNHLEGVRVFDTAKVDIKK
jgi:hypothetical protein